MAKPYLKLYKLAADDSSDLSTELDITTFIADGGLQIEHNDLDAKNDNTDGGREITTGLMARTRIANKHTLTVKLRRISAADAHRIFVLLIPQPYDGNTNPFLRGRYHSPCQNAGVSKIFYCSSINYGAQRYDRNTDDIFYDGMTFKLIEK